MSAEKAKTIVEKYDTLPALLDAFRAIADENERRKMLADLNVCEVTDTSLTLFPRFSMPEAGKLESWERFFPVEFTIS